MLIHIYLRNFVVRPCESGSMMCTLCRYDNLMCPHYGQLRVLTKIHMDIKQFILCIPESMII
jgi:hypothetical protein